MNRWTVLFAVAVLLDLASGCATHTTQHVATGAYKVGAPYQIAGVWYYPKDDPFYDETGVASWYGEDFHGKATANGETYDMNSLTAAHRTLPLPTMVRVTNLENGRSIKLRVNDRGPYARGRILDVSRHAAQLLGFQSSGTARVRVEYEGRATGSDSHGDDSGVPAAATIQAAPMAPVSAAELAPPPGAQSASRPATGSPTTSSTSGPVARPQAGDPDGVVTTMQVPASTQLWIQVGAFSARSNAERLVSGLSGVGRPQISQLFLNGKPLYRVRFGPFSAVEGADAMLDKVIGAGQNGAQIVVE